MRELRLDETAVAKLPESMAAFKELKTLTLNYNPDLQHIPPFLGAFEHLEVLKALYSGLTELPHNIGNLRRLKHLLLDGNNFTTLPPSIVKLKNLVYLSLEKTPLEELTPPVKAWLKDLEEKGATVQF